MGGPNGQNRWPEQNDTGDELSLAGKYLMRMLHAIYESVQCANRHCAIRLGLGLGFRSWLLVRVGLGVRVGSGLSQKVAS